MSKEVKHLYAAYHDRQMHRKAKVRYRAPRTFQRTVNQILRPHSHDTESFWDEHPEYIKELLETIKLLISLNHLKNCYVEIAKVKYLEPIGGSGEHGLYPEPISASKNLKFPRASAYKDD